MAAEVGQVGAYQLLTEALGQGDAETARAAADKLLRAATDTLLSAFDSTKEK